MYYNNRGGYSYVKNSWDYLLWKGFRYWYHFDTDGFMQVGWFTDGFGNRFYLSVIHDNWYGHMLTDWQQIDGFWYYFTPTNSKYAGRMLTGWQFIGGKWYYFETRDNIKGRPIGSLYMNTVTPDGYRVGADGTWIDSPVQV